jgi:hypothetical protein
LYHCTNCIQNIGFVKANPPENGKKPGKKGLFQGFLAKSTSILPHIRAVNFGSDHYSGGIFRGSLK